MTLEVAFTRATLRRWQLVECPQPDVGWLIRYQSGLVLW